MRWEISPDFKTRRPGDFSRTVRTSQLRIVSSSDHFGRATAVLSLLPFCSALLLFLGGAHGPQIIASVKDRAFRVTEQLRAHDPFLRRPGIDYTPTAAIPASGGRTVERSRAGAAPTRAGAK